MHFNTLLWQLDEGILTLTLCRPDHLNAFTVEMAQKHCLIQSYRVYRA